MKENSTLNYYNKIAEEYTGRTVNVKFSSVRNNFTKYLKKGALILDLGCGSGRDSKAFLEEGFKVEALDGSKRFCEIALENTGINVKNLRFNQLAEDNKYDGIWACASLLHVSSIELPDILKLIYKALKPNGYFYCSFKYGSYEGFRNGRQFTNYTEDSFNKLVQNFKLVEQWIGNDVRKGRENEKWLNTILKK